MNFKHLLTCAAVAMMAFPAVASAQFPIQPPGADNYLQPYFVSDDQQDRLQYDAPVGFTADTTNYTLQADMFNPNGDGTPSSGGPPEPNECGSSTYANTIWSVFYADKYGVMRIETAGPFDSVIGIVPFRSPYNDPRPLGISCFDGLSGFQEQAAGLVFPGEWYAVQVGGTGTPPGGQVQVKFELDRPPRVGGDAVLTWNGVQGGIKVKSLVVKAPKGSKVAVKCVRKKCGKNPRPFTARKGLFNKPIAAVGPADSSSGVRMRPLAGGGTPSDAAPKLRSAAARRSSVSPQAHAAKNYKLLGGRKLKLGTRLQIRLTRPGFVGTYFEYNVSLKGAPKVKRCMNPGSNKPRKRCIG
jgi:hypothetical protein